MIWEQFKKWGPYLSYGYDSSSEMIVSWESEQYLNFRRIYYGTTEECENLIEEKNFSPTRHHSIKLTNLKPNTKYYYNVERWGQKSEKDIHTFKTGPNLSIYKDADKENNSFEFTVLGDIHASANAGDVISYGWKCMDKNSPNRAFNIAVGDTINDGNNESDWQAFFKYLNPWLPNKPLMNTTGNHETNNIAKYCRFISTWDHPFLDTKLGGFYSFRYANAAFLMLDSCNAGGTASVEGLPSDEEYEWIESELEKYSSQNLWIFMFLHHQIYSTGDFSMPVIMNDIFKPLCDDYHVDAVFYGHDHHYELFWFGYNDNTIPDWGGTKFLVAGGSGGQQRVDHSIMGDREGKTKYIWPSRVYSYKKDGIIPPSKNISADAMGFRNDEIVKNAQVYGVLEPSYVSMQINGDRCTLKCIGWQNQIHHQIEFNKTIKSNI